MKLLEYMRAKGLNDAAMARLVGGITSHGIRKIKYGERSPSLRVATRIEEVTGGLVHTKSMLQTPHQQVAERIRAPLTVSPTGEG